MVPFIGKLNPWSSTPVPLLLAPVDDVKVPNTTNITLPTNEYYNSSSSMCPLPNELICFRDFYPELPLEEDHMKEENSTTQTSKAMPLSSDGDDEVRYIWMNSSISPTVVVICSVVVLFILDIPWWRQCARRVHDFFTEGKRKGKELEETKLLLQLAKEESETKQKELQELGEQLKSAEERLSQVEGQIQEEEQKSASLEAQVEFLQQISKTEKEKMESQLVALTEKKSHLEKEMKQVNSQCLELVSVVKNKGAEDEESHEPVSSEEEGSTLAETLHTLFVVVQESFQKNTQEKQELAQQIRSLQEQKSSANREVLQLSEKVKASEKQTKNLMQELSKERQQAKEDRRAHEKNMEKVIQEKEQDTKTLEEVSKHNTELEIQLVEARARLGTIRDEVLGRKEYEIEKVRNGYDDIIANVRKEMGKQKRIEAIFTQLLLQSLSTIKPEEVASASWKSTADDLFAKCKATAISQYESELLQEQQSIQDRVLFKKPPTLSVPGQSEDDLAAKSSPASPTEPTLFGGLLKTSNPNFQAPAKPVRRFSGRQSLGSFM